jgi:Tetratricopeptide repeat/PEGA domain
MRAPILGLTFAGAVPFLLVASAATLASAQGAAAGATPAQPASAEAPPAADSGTQAQQPAAPSPDAIKEAGERYTRGISLYADGEYVLALVEFERAYQLAPNYKVLYNIGQVRIQLGRYAKAREALQQYLEQGGDDIAAERRRAVSADLEMLAQRTAKLAITVSEAGAEISLDGQVVGTSPLGDPLVVDAGEHTVEVRKVGFYDKAQRVTLAGRDEIPISVELAKVPEAEQRSVVVEHRTERVDTGKSARTTMWIGWAATGTLAIGAGVVGYLGVTKANDLESMRTDYGVSRQQLDDTKSSARTLFMISDITGAAAVIVGGLSLYLTLSNASSGSPQPDRTPKPSAPRVGLGLGPGSLKVSGTF